jgi:hypothetical protein
MRVLLVAVILACACGGVAPQRKVAMLGVERPSGAHDRTYEAWLARRVDRAFDVVEAADRATAGEITERDIRRVAKHAGAAAVVYGELSKRKKGRMQLTIKVHDGRTGELIETHELAIRNGKIDAKQERRFARELLASLPPPPAATDDTKSVPPKPRHEARPPPEDEPEADEVVAVDEPEPEHAEVRTAERKPDVRAPERRPEAKRARQPEPKPAAPAFEPAERAVPTRYNGKQAVDDEMPTLLAKKK